MGRLLIEVQFHDDNGDPLTGGKLYFYESGTTTPKTTYVDEDQTTPNANPIILDANGRCTDGIWYDGAAKLVCKDSDDATIPNGTFDPVYAGAVGGSSGGGTDNDPWTWYSASVSYEQYDLVVDPTTRLWYQSTQNSNQNNSLTDETYWVEMKPIYTPWNSERTFQANDYVYYSGLLYRSKTASNQGNTPSTDLTNWEALGYQFRHQDLGTITNGNTATMDVVAYNRFTITKDTGADITMAFSNEADILALDWVIDIRLIRGEGATTTITWPSNVEWPFNVEPEWTATTAPDVITMIKYPNDNTWFASLYTQNSA